VRGFRGVISWLLVGIQEKLQPEIVSGYLIYRFGDALRFSRNAAACQ
jgi:hypothetical protein